MGFRHRLRTLPRRIQAPRTIKENIVVIDSVLPNKDAVGPRNSDLIEFSKRLPGFKYYTMYPMPLGEKSWYSHTYGMTAEVFNSRLGDYEQMYPITKGKIAYLSNSRKYKINLAYTYFLADTYALLPFLEKNKVPFVFLLNPGGGFGIDNDSSDDMLREVISKKSS
jgi:hypothetical protein